MLNLLRDAAGFERTGCQFVDSRDALGINKRLISMERAH